MSNRLELFIDGACLGNPGHSGIGVVIKKDGQVIKNISQYIGEGTNNIAEYSALIFGLQEAILLKAQILKINSDSELLCRQLNKQYQVKSPNIIGLYQQALQLISGFSEVVINHVPREQNSDADRLASQAAKEGKKKQLGK